MKTSLLTPLSVLLSVPNVPQVSVPSPFPRRSTLVTAAQNRPADTADSERVTKRVRLDVIGTVVSRSVWICEWEEIKEVWDVADGSGMEA